MSLHSDPLFIGLTRPAMIFGVNLQFVVFNMLITIVSFIQLHHIFILVAGIMMHFVGYVLSFKDPRFMDIYVTKVTKCPFCKNYFFYGANSYSI
ncbi:MAG: type IV secretion system protein VirB3 [Rickettsiaceae bacterium]